MLKALAPCVENYSGSSHANMPGPSRLPAVASVCHQRTLYAVDAVAYATAAGRSSGEQSQGAVAGCSRRAQDARKDSSKMDEGSSERRGEERKGERRDRGQSAEEALAASERRFRAVVEQSPLAVHVFAPDGRSIKANGAWNTLWSLTEGEEPEGTSVFDDEQLHAAGLIPYLQEGVAGMAVESPPLAFDPARVGRDGDPKWLRGLVYPVRNDAGEVTEVALLLEDVTERKNLEDRLAYQAFHDPLTGLPNRTLLLDRLAQALMRAQHRSERDTERDAERTSERGFQRGQQVALLFMDLDNFKYVNDSLGHDSGDRLLVEVARRLQGRLRPADTVARLGGDEFVVLLEEVEDAEEVLQAAERISSALAAPFALSGEEVFAPASIGIALGGAWAAGPPGAPGAPGGRGRPEELLRKADLAMYEAKRRGKGRHVVYEAAMGTQVGERLKLENDLRRALARNEFTLYYQPKVSLTDGRVVGVEALLRWNHPERGLVSPAEFIPLAEETGLIVAIGRWVLRRACQQAHEWRSEGPWRSEGSWQERWAEEDSGSLSTPTMWVNLSARQLQEPDLSRQVSAALEETGLDATGLGLEITESVLVGDGSASVSLLEDLKALGVKLAVDDFGTGYSSLAYLKRLPVDYLKIDRSFVGGLGVNAGDEMIVSAVMGLARAMKLEIVAEGVETAGQLERLREMGCERGQGYYWSRPLPSEAASEILLADWS